MFIRRDDPPGSIWFNTLCKLEHPIREPVAGGMLDVHPELRSTPPMLAPPIAAFKIKRILPSSKSFAPSAVGIPIEIAD
jgi:hypothetical protein